LRAGEPVVAEYENGCFGHIVPLNDTFADSCDRAPLGAASDTVNGAVAGFDPARWERKSGFRAVTESVKRLTMPRINRDQS
jgi:hypothetical protein